MKVLEANLILHHRVTNIFDHGCKFVRIPDVGEKPLDRSLVYQWLELSAKVLQFPNDTPQIRFSISDVVSLPS